MGCGASGGGGGRYKAEQTAVQSAGKEVGPDAEARDCPWHRKNCSDVDLWLVKTILEAYPFDDSDRKEVKKTEKVLNEKVLDGNRHHEWGTVSVAKRGPKKVNCSACGKYILDRNEEKYFWYCIRCRKEGNRCDLCVNCYDNGILATADRQRTAEKIQTKTGTPHRDSLSQAPVYSAENSVPISGFAPSMGGRGSLSVPLQEPRLGSKGGGSRNSSRNNSPRGVTPHPSIHSGVWKGKLTENGSERAVVYKMLFQSDGVVVGRGPNDCEVNGTFRPQATIFKGNWTETHTWGSITAEMDVLPERQAVSGKFKASDGGGGTFVLRAVEAK